MVSELLTAIGILFIISIFSGFINLFIAGFDCWKTILKIIVFIIWPAMITISILAYILLNYYL